MKSNILERINLLNIELNQSTPMNQMKCLEQLIDLEKKLLDIIKTEINVDYSK